MNYKWFSEVSLMTPPRGLTGGARSELVLD